MTLKELCELLDYPRLRRWAHLVERVKAAEASAAEAGAAPRAEAAPEGEVHLRVEWVRFYDDSGGQYPRIESKNEWLCGISDDSRLGIPLVWTEGKYNWSERRRYTTLYFVAPIAEVEGKTLVINGRALGPIAYSNIPAAVPRYRDVPAELIDDRGDGWPTIKMPQVREAPAGWTATVRDELGIG